MHKYFSNATLIYVIFDVEFFYLILFSVYLISLYFAICFLFKIICSYAGETETTDRSWGGLMPDVGKIHTRSGMNLLQSHVSSGASLNKIISTFCLSGKREEAQAMVLLNTVCSLS